MKYAWSWLLPFGEIRISLYDFMFGILWLPPLYENKKDEHTEFYKKWNIMICIGVITLWIGPFSRAAYKSIKKGR